MPQVHDLPSPGIIDAPPGGRWRQTRNGLGGSWRYPTEQNPTTLPESSRRLAKRVLVPLDLSADNRMAVDLAWLLACQSSGLICLLHVLEPVPFISALRTSPLFRSDLKVARAAMRQLRRMADSLHDPRVTVGAMVRTGDPAREICNVAELLDADLIVLSLRRSSSFDRFFRRAIAEAVLRRATTAVLVLPSGGSTAVNAPHA